MADSTRVEPQPALGPGMFEELLFRKWVELLRQAYMFAKGEHYNRLTMRSVSRFDSRGVNPYSEVWGAIFFIQSLIPGLHDLGVVDPVSMRADAREQALLDLERDLESMTIRQLIIERRQR